MRRQLHRVAKQLDYIAFRYATLLNIVAGKTPRPIAVVEGDEWDRQNDKALVMILSAVHADLTIHISSCDTATEAWKFLAGRFDRDTSNTSVQLFRSITNLRYHDGDDLRTHVDHFYTL
ncbi:hypothetical protein P3342_004798 [Pyrenophora teres f. teres]|uniref:Uncharacterized protein n=2 Tax=Pyrenophora teres f. teres TaxID=97479 RepID=E3RZV8_PYRTT|nr:hypothetical protein PTT_15279 [Pyrenophora teres f. teres 0-1]KAE8846492.1 hypothetical protein HRS9139_01059 [Pyrenophora teres f. teres]KAE8848635.1 hypothetical protein PTNB85_02478 [Pyrenophora teres f. teres]KAE8853195.1 hypothetical protein HRS9122_00187 [Pyrenophora teres f. teres]KAE8868560.1 hypothetical protein PTNB29_02471 [Pyrenophora teres f. teres]